MKVFFDFDIIFKDGRISRKQGNADIQSEDNMSIEDRKKDEDLKQFIGWHISKQYKTGNVFNVEITDIK